jgi:hypothetical protein
MCPESPEALQADHVPEDQRAESCFGQKIGARRKGQVSVSTDLIGGPWAIWTVPPTLVRIKLK